MVPFDDLFRKRCLPLRFYSWGTVLSNLAILSSVIRPVTGDVDIFMKGVSSC
ncbi:MAG TPA: hypothetical protein PLK82_07580 [Bacteroidales bacterium]|nr:hypothetical protein [Bacteroidales bacterium]